MTQVRWKPDERGIGKMVVLRGMTFRLSRALSGKEYNVWYGQKVVATGKTRDEVNAKLIEYLRDPKL
jgi:hypothetical protein